MNREQWQAALIIGYFYISAQTLCCPSSVGRSQLFILRQCLCPTSRPHLIQTQGTDPSCKVPSQHQLPSC